MKISSAVVAGLAVTLCVGLAAQAQTNSSEMSFDEIAHESALPDGWKPFIGLSTGYMSDGGRYATEGVPTSIKALGSFYSFGGNWVFDIGGGLQHQTMTNNNSATLPLLEAAARYQVGSGWQMGPILNTYIGESDRYGSANANFTNFIGANVGRDFLYDGQLFRAGGTVMTDLDISGEQVAILLANVSMSFDVVREQSEPAVQPVAYEEPRPAQHLINRAQDLPPQKPLARFALEKADLHPQDRLYLRRVASLLKMNAKQFNKVTLVGHADSSGPEMQNQRLSVERSIAVKKYLVGQGVPESKLAIAGRSSKDPISSELDPNRRVEIRFTSGVPSNLENALRSLE